MSIGQNLSFFANGFDLAGYLQSFDLEAEGESIDASVLANNYRTKEQGFKYATIAGSGVFSTDSTNLDTLYDVMQAAFASGNENIISASLEQIAVGGANVMMDAVNVKLSTKAPLGLLITNDILLTSNNAFSAGKWLRSSQLNAGTSNGTSVDNSAGTANGGLWHSHWENTSATGIVLTLQHSTDNSTWTDLTETIAGTRAVGSYTFAANPTAADTIIFNGVTFTFIAGVSTATDIQIKGSRALTMVEAATVLNASVNGSVSVATYTATSTGISVSYDAPGTGGNAYTLNTPTAGNVTRSGATLLTGTNAAAGHDADSVTIAPGTTVNRYLRAKAVITGGNTVLVTAAFARR